MKRSSYSFGYDALSGAELRRLSSDASAILEGSGRLTIVDGDGTPVSDVDDLVPRLLATIDARDATIEQLRSRARGALQRKRET